jgi:hypothetical protein
MISRLRTPPRSVVLTRVSILSVVSVISIVVKALLVALHVTLLEPLLVLIFVSVLRDITSIGMLVGVAVFCTAISATIVLGISHANVIAILVTGIAVSATIPDAAVLIPRSTILIPDAVTIPISIPVTVSVSIAVTVVISVAVVPPIVGPSVVIAVSISVAITVPIHLAIPVSIMIMVAIVRAVGSLPSSLRKCGYAQRRSYC